MLGNATRSTWRICLEARDRVGVEGMVTPTRHPGSAAITLSEDGEVKVWQPVFNCSHGVTMTREEQVEYLFSILCNWSMSLPNLLLTSKIMCRSSLFLKYLGGSLVFSWFLRKESSLAYLLIRRV